MGIKVYGSPVSPGVRRVLAALSEKELDYEFINVNMMTGDHKKEPFISINPFGQVPGFEDGDVKLFESRAIVRYIEQAYKDKNPLSFDDAKKMGPVYSWMEAEALHFDTAAGSLAFQLALAPLFGMPTNDAVVAEKEAKLGPVLDIYEARLSKSKYLGADTYTLADMLHLPTIHYLSGTKAKALFDARPHVKAWVADILARPAWARVLEKTKA
ncbi:OLC1v1004266C1 [Oldenlandia corymbosa var. corymbosa]|uniref:glutathione transferase n=1 Tax=Oldenlandia corymbosa var. corymbosa TaxID=529605 RepID=A0AAV1DEK0_OLDCO|nr:OLC1v1004266C1 [Oldenlandia corymbosa var. corymbosa]